MTDEIPPEVKIDDPATPDPKEPEETDPKPPESSPEDPDDLEGDEPEDPEPIPAPAPKVAVVIPTDGTITRLADETDREFAQRLEIKRLRDNAKKDRSKEILDQPSKPAPTPKTESEILKKYKPEEIASLREVLPELAKELGYVKSSDLAASSYEEKAQVEIDAFITAHPEYSPEKDPDGLLWGRLKEEYQNVYKPPQNPKDFGKIFNRIHKDLFGIEGKAPLPKVAAAKEKVTVASHTGASAPQRLNRSPKTSTGLRTDMLKGFSDEEIAGIESRAAE